MLGFIEAQKHRAITNLNVKHSFKTSIDYKL